MERRRLPRITWGGVLVWVGCPLAGVGFLALAGDFLDYAVPALGGTLPLRLVLFWTAIAAVGSALAVVGDLARRQSRAAAVPA